MTYLKTMSISEALEFLEEKFIDQNELIDSEFIVYKFNKNALRANNPKFGIYTIKNIDNNGNCTYDVRPKDVEEYFNVPTNIDELSRHIYITKETTLSRSLEKKLQQNDFNDLDDEYRLIIARSQLLKDYAKSNKNKKSLENILKLDEYDVVDSDVEWLIKNTKRIEAIVPPKYIKEFEKNFPNQPYRSSNQWGIAFKLYLNSNVNFNTMPSIFNNIGQNDPMNPGNPALNKDKKTFNSTAYIWKLVKNYPEYFKFS